MSVSSSSMEEEVVKKMKRRSSFAPGRRSLVPNVVSDAESETSSNDSLTDDKMMTGLIHELIAEHKQEQTDWNVYIKREKKKTEDFLNDENLVVDFSSMPDGPDDLPTKYQDAIAKSRKNLEGHREALRQLRERAQVADVEMEKIVDRVELAAMKQRRKVAEAMAAMKRKGNLEEEKTKQESIETLLVSDDSGIGVDASTVCGNNNNLAADHKHH